MNEESPNGYPAFLGSEIEQADSQHALFHVIPVPLERTVSYGSGTRLGPSAILKASWQLEAWDGRSNASDLGIHTCEPVHCEGEGNAVIERIAAVARNIAGSASLPVAIGGEHSATFGVIRGLLEAGVTDLGIVQIDAHADLRDRYEGDPLSHASVMKRCLELGIPLFQLGTRAYCEEEIQARREYRVRFRDADELVQGQVSAITLPEDFPRNVYFTLDVDGVDPSVFPSTGTPVPGGLGWYQTLGLFESVCRQSRIVGFDVMEFAPIPAFHAYDFAASLLIQKMMGIVQRTRTSPGSTPRSAGNFGGEQALSGSDRGRLGPRRLGRAPV